MKMLNKPRILAPHNLLNCIANRNWLGRVDLEPHLHPLYDKRHDELKNEKVVIGDHLKEWKDDLW